MADKKKKLELYNPKQKIIKKSDKQYRIPTTTLVTIVIIFLGTLGIAFTYAETYTTRRQIVAVRREIQEQKEANISLRTEITQRYTLDEVARQALGRLNMNEPDPSQIYYIEVPKQSYVVLNPDIQEETDDTNYFWQGIVRFFEQFF
jgi:cell division protein FtsL